jgi:hypothetical protein
MVNVPRLVSAVQNLAWRHGIVTGDSVAYRAEADGAHVITITVPPHLVDQVSLPKPPLKGGGLGAVTPDMKKEPT